MSIEYCCLPPMKTSLEHNIGNTLFLDLSEKRIFLLKHFDIVLYYMNKVGFDISYYENFFFFYKQVH